MAYINTVPQGRAGTGNATIYGDNPVAAQFGNQLANLRQQEYQDQLLAQQKAEQQARIWRDNQLAASGGRLWAGDIGKIEQDHIQRGIELQQKGVNPYGVSPAALDYQKERRAVEAQQGFRKATETQLNSLLKQVNANPDKYEPKDIKNLNDFFANTKLSDAYNSNTALPELRERFNANDYLKGIQAVTKETKDLKGGMITEARSIDQAATENAIIGALSRDSRGKEYLDEMSSGVPVNQLRTFSINPQENKKRIRESISGDPRVKVELAKNGIVEGTPQMDEFINQMASEQARAKTKFDNGIAPLISASAEGLNLFSKNTPYTPPRDPNEMTAYQRASLAMRQAEMDKKAEDHTPMVPKDTIIPYAPDDNGVAKGVMEVKDFIPISIPGKNFAGSPAWKMGSGKKAKLLPSSDNYAIVGVGNFPIIKEASNVKSDLRGALSQPEYAKRNPGNIDWKAGIHVREATYNTITGRNDITDLVVPYDRFPENAKTKQVQGLLSKFVPAGQKQASSTISIPTMVTVILNGKTGQVPKDKLADFRKKYPNAQVK